VGLAITKSESKRLKLGTKAMTLGTSTVVTLPAATPTTISVAVAAKYRARLRRATKLNGTLILVCADASNRTYAGQLPVHLAR